MAVSNLASALIGGQTASPLMGDPAMMAAMPDIQLGQSLEQQGISTAPAYPTQALARLAQTLAGQSLVKGGLSDLANAYGNSADSMAQIFPPDTPLGAALRSPNPLVRMQALQEAPKALLLNSERYKLSPGEESHGMGANSPNAVSGQPQSDIGKTEADAERAAARGNPAASQAIGRVITKQGAHPETGVPFPPTNVVPTADQMAAARQRLAQGLGAVQNSGVTNTQPNGVAAEGQNVRNQAPQGPAIQSMPAAIAQAKGTQTQAEKTGEARAEYGGLMQPQGPLPKGPGLTDPVTTEHGTTIPPLANQQPIPTEPAQLKEKLPIWNKTTTDWNASLATGQQAEQRLNTIANAFKQIQSGSYATNKADIIAGLNAAGIPIPQSAMNNVSAVQTALHENYISTIQKLKASNSRWTQLEFKALAENSEHPNLQPSANLQMISEDLAAIRQNRDMVTDWNTAQRYGWHDPQSFEAEWLKNNKNSDYVQRIKGEIGPLKGMTPSHTAVNKQTGEKLGLFNGQWLPLPQQ